MDSEKDFSALLQELKGEEFLTIFQSGRIDETALKYMKPHHLDRIIPNELMGPRIIFEYFLKQWQKKQNIETVITEAKCTPSSKSAEVQTTTVKFKEEDLHEQNDSTTPSVLCELKDQSEDDKNTTEETDEDEEGEEELEQTSSLWNTTTTGGNTDVHLIQIEEILKASSGDQILDYYSRNGSLNSKYRQMMGACIVKHLIEKKVFPRPKHFDLISDDIVNYFKNEEKSFYYKHRTGRKPAGILYAKYHNSLTRLRKEGYDELDLLPLATVRNNSLEQRLIPIEEILQDSSNGKLLLDFYAKNSYLTTKHRPMLAGCIVDYLIANDIVPHREDFDIIADRVVQYFKTEDKEIYYIPAVKYKKPGGCLYSKYHNQPKTRRDGLSDTESNHTQSSEKVGGKRKHRDTGTSKKASDRPVDTILAEQIDWLKNNLEETYEKVLEKWENTHRWRMSFMEEEHTLNEILEEWPLYKQPFGYKLIDNDFSKKHPNKMNNLFNKWEHFRKVIMPLLRGTKDPECTELLKEFSENEEQTAEFTNCLILYVIHSILKPTTTSRVYDKKTKRMKITKSTMADSRNSFMIIGSTFPRLKEKIKRLKDNEEKDVETFLPILAGVGEVESMFDLSEYYVFCGNVCYKLENIIHSLDIAFKMFNVLNLRYPPHCKLVWFFIQEYFYEIKIPTQEKSNSLAELLNDVNIRKVQ